MSSRRGRLGSTLALALVLPALLGGCGKQGPPLPPLRAVPAPTKDLAATQQGAQIVLSFTYPKTTASGLALAGISAVEVLEAVKPAAADGKAGPMDPREFTAAAKPRLKVEGADLTTATSGDRMVLSLPVPAQPVPTVVAAPAAPQAHYYAVRTFSPDGDRSDPSNVSSVVPKAPPSAPERVTVTPRADGVLVEWSGVEAAAGGYNIYRRDAQERFHGQPVHAAAAADRSWLDNTARFGQNYIYTVTALAQRDPAVESAVGSEHEVRYQDRFAPPAPGDLVALAETGRVRLVWRSVDADDLAGYIVYRRAGSGSFERIMAQPMPAPEFNDVKAAAGQTYGYRVTAIDKSGNESDPSPEVRAQVP
jgi:hypothetical protein